MWQQSVRVQQHPPARRPRPSARWPLQNEKAQASQQEMLKQLRDDVRSRSRTTRSLDWNPVTFKLTEETSDGPPAVGVLDAVMTVGSGRRLADRMSQEAGSIHRVTDGTGIADFGVVHPGRLFLPDRQDLGQRPPEASGRSILNRAARSQADRLPQGPAGARARSRPMGLAGRSREGKAGARRGVRSQPDPTGWAVMGPPRCFALRDAPARRRSPADCGKPADRVAIRPLWSEDVDGREILPMDGRPLDVRRI